MVPGTRALAFVTRWFDPSTVSGVFEPLIADWQREWRDAAGFARFGVRIRGGSALLLSMIAASPNVLFAPWPANTLRRVMTRVTIWTTVVTALMLMPFVIDLKGRVNVGVFLYLLVLLLPQAAALAFPLAITTIVDVIRTAPRPTREERIAAVRFAIAACSLMLVLAGWVYPASNQHFRVTASRPVHGTSIGPGLAPGLRELSIFYLSRDESLKSELWRDGRELWPTGRAEAVRSQIASRTSMMVLPIVLMWARWRSLLLPRGHWYSPLPLALSAPLLFGSYMFLLRGFADSVYAPRWTGPFLALTILVVASLGVDHLRRRAARLAVGQLSQEQP